MIYHWSLSDSKSPQVSRTLLSILAVLNNAVVWMVSTPPPNSKSSSPLNNPLVTVPKAPITIGIIVTIMFHRFFNSLASFRYLSIFSHYFSFILWQPGLLLLMLLLFQLCLIIFWVWKLYFVWLVTSGTSMASCRFSFIVRDPTLLFVKPTFPVLTKSCFKTLYPSPWSINHFKQIRHLTIKPFKKLSLLDS